MTRDTFGLTIPSALHRFDAQEITLLRLLGRLELLSAAQIARAVFPHLTLRGAQYRIERLLAQDLLWSAPSRLIGVEQAAHARTVTRLGTRVFGLSDQGKALLERMEVETDPLTIGRLRSRDPRGRKAATQTMAHDLQVSWWCLNALLSAAQSRCCRSIYVQVEFIPERRQRIDALLILRFSPERPRPLADMGRIPFFDGRPRAADEVDVRLALEVDTGTEELRVLLGKGQVYRDLEKSGVYTTLFGGPLLVVFLAQTARRAAQIAREFQHIWPEGWGVVSTPLGALDEADGVLWGDYRTLTAGESFPLLSSLTVGADGQVRSAPLFSRASWRASLAELPPPAPTPEQLAGRRGGRARRERPS